MANNNERTSASPLLPLYVVFHFIFTDINTNEELDRSDENDPVRAVIGRTDEDGERVGWPPKIEDALARMAVGSSRVLRLSPADGWGDFDEDAVIEFDTRTVKHGDQEFTMVPMEDREVGKVVTIQVDGEDVDGVVIEVTESKVAVDTNHPMAGRRVKAEITLCERREPTAIELQRANADLDL